MRAKLVCFFSLSMFWKCWSCQLSKVILPPENRPFALQSDAPLQRAPSMTRTILAIASDSVLGDMIHTQFHSAGDNSVWAMPAEAVATSLPALEERTARHLQSINISSSAGSTASCSAEPAQELADVLRGIWNEQQQIADVANFNDNNQSAYSCLNSINGITTSPSSRLFQNLQPMNPVSAHPHAADSGQLIDLDVLDAEILQQDDGIIPSSTMSDEGCLLMLPNPFSILVAADDQNLSSSTPLINPTDEYNKSQEQCTLGPCCICNDCRGSDILAQAEVARFTSTSMTNAGNSDCEYVTMACSSCTSNGVPCSDGHQRLEPVLNLDPTSAASPAPSFDDYSLGSISAGLSSAVLPAEKKLPPSMPAVLSSAAAQLEFLNADEAFDNGHNCGSQQDMAALKAVAINHQAGHEEVNFKDHMVSETLKIDGGNDCIRDAASAGASNDGYIATSSDFDEGLVYRRGCMKAMQREAVYAAAAMQPVNWAGVLAMSAGSRPKRRNVRISHDPQTVSARRRRERISDRIRVLQRMVPGGTKMDTASMLDEAIHYLKYLKSQVQALEWLERKASGPSPPPSMNCLSSSLLSSISSPCSYPNLNSNYIQRSPNSTLMII